MSTLTRERLAQLRALVEDESMSWGDVADLQGAFEEIDPVTLPTGSLETAGWADMLDELEARLPTVRVRVWRDRMNSPISGGRPWNYSVQTGGRSVELDFHATHTGALGAALEAARRYANVAHHEPTD